jgi:hypothetical protein
VKAQAQRRTVVYGVEIVPAVRVMLQVELEPESRSGAGNGVRVVPSVEEARPREEELGGGFGSAGVASPSTRRAKL